MPEKGRLRGYFSKHQPVGLLRQGLKIALRHRHILGGDAGDGKGILQPGLAKRQVVGGIRHELAKPLAANALPARHRPKTP